jgi:hypothetical protein
MAVGTGCKGHCLAADSRLVHVASAAAAPHCWLLWEHCCGQCRAVLTPLSCCCCCCCQFVASSRTSPCRPPAAMKPALQVMLLADHPRLLTSCDCRHARSSSRNNGSSSSSRSSSIKDGIQSNYACWCTGHAPNRCARFTAAADNHHTDNGSLATGLFMLQVQQLQAGNESANTYCPCVQDSPTAAAAAHNC